MPVRSHGSAPREDMTRVRLRAARRQDEVHWTSTTGIPTEGADEGGNGLAFRRRGWALAPSRGPAVTRPGGGCHGAQVTARRPSLRLSWPHSASRLPALSQPVGSDYSDYQTSKSLPRTRRGQRRVRLCDRQRPLRHPGGQLPGHPAVGRQDDRRAPHRAAAGCPDRGQRGARPSGSTPPRPAVWDPILVAARQASAAVRAVP